MANLIYNRAPTDFYNVADINRVEDAIQTAAAQLRGMGLSITGKSRKTWTAASIPRQSAIDDIRNAINEMRDVFFVDAVPPDWRYFFAGDTTTSVTEWNAWEYDLVLLFDYLDAAASNMTFRRAGTAFMISGVNL